MKIPPEPNSSTPVASASARLPQRMTWYAVSVMIGWDACEAVRTFAKTRWLSADAPRFPVSGCSALSCDCRYKHHDDRRAVDQRSSDRGGIPRHHAGPERGGQQRGRRSTDL